MSSEFTLEIQGNRVFSVSDLRNVAVSCFLSKQVYFGSS